MYPPLAYRLLLTCCVWHIILCLFFGTPSDFRLWMHHTRGECVRTGAAASKSSSRTSSTYLSLLLPLLVLEDWYATWSRMDGDIREQTMIFSPALHTRNTPSPVGPLGGRSEVERRLRPDPIDGTPGAHESVDEA